MKFPQLLILTLILTLTISFASATDVAYVLKNTANANSVLISSLQQINASYSLIDDSAIGSTNFSKYKLILVQDDISSLVSLTNSLPSIVISDYYSAGWSAGTGSFASSQILKGENLMSSPLNIGMPQEFELYTSCCSASGINLPASYLTGRKYNASDSTHQLTDSYDYIVAYKSSPRRVFFGITEIDYWSLNTKKLFKNSVNWIMNGADTDGDGKYDYQDNCPLVANANQTDTDSDGIGDACDACALDSANDADSDGICGNVDNCALISNPSQENFDKDLLGDSCDSDIDNDNITNTQDQCDYTPPNFIIGLDGCGKSNYLVINEIEFDNPGTDTNEFVEIYNPTNETIILTGWRIQDSRGRIDIISHGNITANGYFMFSESLSVLDFLNNDSIKLYDTNGTLIDETPFLVDSSEDDQTWQRKPDASEVWKFGLQTRGKNNDADVTKPVVTLLLPLNNSLIESSNMTFNYTASDNQALILSCNFYANINGAFRSLGNDTMANGTISSFVASGIPDGTYIWNIKCSDSSSNEAFSSSNRTIIVNKIEAPVFTLIGNKTLYENETLAFVVNASDADNDPLNYSAISLPSGSSFINQTFSWTPSFSQAGSYNVTFIVSDSRFESRMNVSIRVLDKNRAPSLIQDIPNKYFDEDSYLEINLTQYFSDLDLEMLTYRLMNNTNIRASFSSNIARFNSTKDWSGVEELMIVANDSQYSVSSNVFLVAVLEVNDAPFLNNIPDIAISEGQVASVILNATDVDSSNLSYSINDSRFIQNNNRFSWETDYSDSGVYYFLVSVSDGINETKKIAKITVTDINEPPHFNPITSIIIDEDSNWTSYNISAYDNDGNVTSYSISQEDTNKVDCKIDNYGLLEVKPAANFYGSSYCTIQAKDNSNSVAYANVSIQVNNVNDAPTISSFSPNFNPKIADNLDYEFNININDIDTNSSELEVRWYLDDVEVGNNTMYLLNEDVGEYNLTVIVSDSSSETSRYWNVITSNTPLTEKYDGDTTDFSSADLNETNLILEKSGIGKIEFLDNVNLENVVDLDRYSEIQRGLAALDSDVFSSLKNKRARITFYGLSYDKTPAIYYKSSYSLDSASSSICSSLKCTNIDYNSQARVFSFEVDSFSSYFVGDTLTCSQKGGRVCSSSEKCLGSLIESRDSNSCCSSSCVLDFKSIETCSNTSSRIKLSVKNPDKDDEFFPGDSIPVELKIENDYDEEKDFDVKIILYDLTKQDEIDSWDDSISIGDDDSETIEQDIEIDDSIEESSEIYIYAIVSSDNLECKDSSVKIDVSREKHKVIIEDFKLNELGNCDRNLNAKIRLMNIGKNKESTRAVLEIPELNLSQKSDIFELEKYGKDDSERLELGLEIPENASGNYRVVLSADYGSGNILEERNITIGECIKPLFLSAPIQVQETTPGIVQVSSTRTSVSSRVGGDWMKVVIILLVIAIIIVFLLIINKLAKRRYS